jgi:hypothetical protein
MLGYKPNHELWGRVNAVILGANAAETLVTLISGLCALLVDAGVCPDEPSARAHLAAVLLSPDTAPKPGSLLPLLQAELARLRDGGK